jgi:hypothetical protein
MRPAPEHDVSVTVLRIRPPPSAAFRSENGRLENGQPKPFNIVTCLWLAGTMGALSAQFALLDPDGAVATACRPRRPLPMVVLKSMGPCNFNAETLSFAGSSVEQAECLIRPVNRWAHLGPPLPELPKTLSDRIGGIEPMPDRAALAALISETGLPSQFADGLNSDISRARDGDAQAPMARYFVIHDTSGPRLGSFPANLDDNVKINNLERFSCSDAAEIAHAFINRGGGVFFGHDFSVPWRSTKFERALTFGTNLKGLFLHVEMIQPRRRGRHGGDITAPTPGFTAAQYRQLALLYTIASVRAGTWLIPAFHAVIDADIRGGHDDPQNFDVEAFARALDAIGERLKAYTAPSSNALSPNPSSLGVSSPGVPSTTGASSPSVPSPSVPSPSVPSPGVPSPSVPNPGVPSPSVPTPDTPGADAPMPPPGAQQGPPGGGD